MICLGVGGLVDMEEALGLESSEDEQGQEPVDHGVEVWIIDARRPWNLQNVFGFGSVVNDSADGTTRKRRRGVIKGKLQSSYRAGRGGIIVFDDGDIEQEFAAEAEAFCELQDMPELGGDEDDFDSDDEEDEDDDEPASDPASRKRKSLSNEQDEDMSGSEIDEDERPRQRRRSNSVSRSDVSLLSNPNDLQSTPIPESPRDSDRFELSNHPTSSQAPPQPSSPPVGPRQLTPRDMRKKLRKLRRKHESVLQAYYSLGTSYSEPMSSLVYNLAEELGREDNDLLWLAIVGVSSYELYGRAQQLESTKRTGDWAANRHERIQQVLRDEVRRLNAVPASDITRERELEETGGIIPTHARSPTDTSIRISPEPRFLLIRHWSLYDSMLHSPYLSTRLHIWSETGRKRLDRLLTKMGVSLDEARKGYTHMDMELKRGLRQRLLKFAPMYGLEGVVPPAGGRSDKEGWGFVRCWGWKACMSALDVAVIVGAILEVGTEPFLETSTSATGKEVHRTIVGSYSSRIRALPTPENSPGSIPDPDFTTGRFYGAYDALSTSPSSLSDLLKYLPTAQHLHRAILRVGAALINKHQIRDLSAFRMGVIKDGPDVSLFTHPGALIKLAGWVSEAVGVLEAEKGKKVKASLVLGCLNDDRGVYVVVGLGGGGAAGRIRSRAEQKEKEEKKKRKEDEKATKAIERQRRREERRRLRRERDEANGIFEEDDEANDSDDTESDASSSDGNDSDSDDDEELKAKREKRGYGLNKFGAAFQEVVEETNARVRIDSFEHSVVEVKKEDFSGFLEALSLKSVAG